MPNELTPGQAGAGPPVAVSHIVVAPERVPPRQGMVAFLSSNERKGRWTLPRHLRAAAVAGSIVIDLREAEISAGVSEIEVFALFGNCEVIVPVGVRVEAHGAG